MPFGIGPLEIVIVLIIVLVIFGPKRLPDLGRSLGRGMREFKDSVTGQEREELPSRLVVSLAALGVAFGLCLWQNHLILEIVNRPLPGATKPITFGVTEPFMTTITNAGYAALLLALPV